MRKLLPNFNFKAEASLFCTLLLCAPSLVLLSADLLYHPINISSWLAMRIYAARLMTEGKELYLDFFDWTQPLLLGTFKLLLQARELLVWLWTGLQAIGQNSIKESLPYFLLPDIYITLVILTALAMSLLIGARLAATGSKDGQHRHWLLLPVALSLTAYVVRFDFGDLQFLLLLSLVPWLLLKLKRAAGETVNTPLALFIGTLAGLAACLDLHYILVFAVLSFLFKPVKKKPAPETLTLLLIPVLYLAWLFALPAEQSKIFYQWAMPVRLLQFTTPNADLFGPDSCAHRFDVWCASALALFTAQALSAKTSFLQTAGKQTLRSLGVLLSAGLALYVIENQGLSKDLILAIFAATSIFLVALAETSRELVSRFSKEEREALPLKYAVIAALLLISMATLAIGENLRQDRQLLLHAQTGGIKSEKVDLETALTTYSRPGSKIVFFNELAQPAYPMLLTYERKPGSYLLFSRPLLLLNWHKEHGKLTDALSEFHNYIHDDLKAALESKDTALVIMDATMLPTMKSSGLEKTISDGFKQLPPGCFYSARNRQPHEYAGYNWEYFIFGRNSGETSQ
ncbi:MAG TPA: hypothetical protein PLC15_09615 [Candidatus Obscuribacter sp.]|nr:hypothetical protein [Candidatus Obscuribacter sp.]HMW92350.1 hypothetical protein [Candidatus Obscuribacter sp.]HNA72000.1 hypothetical protein [Candidatus Obscuribacter sp.]HNB15629.1 hypothetical protein [Candidatus Obscuribacter sp.]HND65170.1 hypothetical protein [Candidatus Obscuribacter sp.]